MSNTKTETPAPNKLADAIKAASVQAESVQPRKSGEVVAGPYPVGNAGEVSVIERPASKDSDNKYLFAEYTPAGGGKIKSFPLAAVATLAKELPA